MAISKFVPSKYAKTIDAIAEIDEQIEELKAQREKLEARLLKASDGSYYGNLAKVAVWTGQSTIFNHAKAKRLLGIEAYAKCWKKTAESKRIRLTALKAE